MQNFKVRGSAHNNRVRYQFYPATEGEMVKLDIHHRDGGTNMFSYKHEAKGIEISITQVKVQKVGNGMISEQSAPMADGNCRLLIAELGRYNAKKLEKVALAFDEAAPEISKLWTEDRDMAIDMIRTTAEAAVASIA